jgi:aryl-alcohol dehydrogenase-like predicted oxidoreductase
MSTRLIGTSRVAQIGLGCMCLSHAYGVPPAPRDAQRVLHRATELGITHFDTAALYGFGANESLLGEALVGCRDRIHLATKCGMTGVDGRRVIDGRPETLQRTCRESLAHLRTDVIDLWYLHRWDKRVPIEDSVGAMADMVASGHVRAIGLSEVSAATLRRASAVHPISAVQNEYSLWSRNPELGLLETCRELGATLVAFAPLGRGFLADSVDDPGRFAPRDIRRNMPRFQPPHFEANRRLLAAYRTLAHEADCTPAQLALAWLLQKSPDVVPIPGTTSVMHLEENWAAMERRLDAGLVARLEALINQRTVSGARYAPETLLEIDTEEPAATIQSE